MFPRLSDCNLPFFLFFSFSRFFFSLFLRQKDNQKAHAPAPHATAGTNAPDAPTEGTTAPSKKSRITKEKLPDRERETNQKGVMVLPFNEKSQRES
jgi:hypothetical protein